MSYFRKAELFPSQPRTQIQTQQQEAPKPRVAESPKPPMLSVPVSAHKPLAEPAASAMNVSASALLAGAKNAKVPSELVYENQVATRLRTPDREEWQQMLTLKLEVRTTGPRSEQTLMIELTDENDPFFLYAMECGESEFINLKNEQNIIVDFQQFPGKFIELLEHCQVARRANMIAEEAVPAENFACVFQAGYSEAAVFNVVQINNFKQLVHLSLKFRPCDDESLKKYLATRLQEFKAENEALRTKLETTEDSLNIQTSTNEKLRADSKSERDENGKLADSIKLDAQRQFNELKEQMLAELEANNAKHVSVQSKLKESLEKQIAELNERLSQAQTANAELSERRLALEARERELTSRVQKQDHEIQLRDNELSLLRGSNKDLDTTKYSQEKELVELKVRCETTERQLGDKDQLVKNATGLYEASKAQCRQLEETIGILKANAMKMEEKLVMSAQEINKGNDIIKQLQAEVKAQKQKCKLKESVTAQQEQLIEQNKRTIEDMTRALNDSKREVVNKEEELKLCKAKIEELKAKLAESQKMLESNEQSTPFLIHFVSDYVAEQVAQQQQGAAGTRHVGSKSLRSFLLRSSRHCISPFIYPPCSILPQTEARLRPTTPTSTPQQ